ncbi:MAG: hypothetical protein KAG97_11185, partial [Victivallales bacterium]|nr:hypothetical protein [Victivallales bacterium]
PIGVEEEDYTGKYPIYVGIIPSSDKQKLRKEEARYVVKGNAAYIYGEDDVYVKYSSPAKVATHIKYNRTGTLFAVYAFLENELGVKWLEPGDKGIVYTPANTLTLREGYYDWTPKLSQRFLRSNSWRWKYVEERQKSIPAAMRISRKEAEKRYADELIWLRRMRMGRNLILNYGHAFTKW